MINKSKVSDYSRDGYNCAEAIIKFYNDEFDRSIPVNLVSAFGGGLCVESVCGAINACSIIIGYEKGRVSENGTKPYIKDFISKIEGRYSSHLCKDIKGDKEVCREIMDSSYEILKEVLYK